MDMFEQAENADLSQQVEDLRQWAEDARRELQQVLNDEAECGSELSAEIVTVLASHNLLMKKYGWDWMDQIVGDDSIDSELKLLADF